MSYAPFTIFMRFYLTYTLTTALSLFNSKCEEESAKILHGFVLGDNDLLQNLLEIAQFELGAQIKRPSFLLYSPLCLVSSQLCFVRVNEEEEQRSKRSAIAMSEGEPLSSFLFTLNFCSLPFYPSTIHSYFIPSRCLFTSFPYSSCVILQSPILPIRYVHLLRVTVKENKYFGEKHMWFRVVPRLVHPIKICVHLLRRLQRTL
ncbi:hypothetical protein PPYR_13725 [Photinus pyralis]|uniref:Uncharacterized protein n=1 Tax=Photinus pyralis TaxID=7054 RepID=A0A5N4A9V4_PHOPY|nr:hypothetical protein PPYR_13725 [Photinus pyralis]